MTPNIDEWNAEVRRNAWARDLGRELASRFDDEPPTGSVEPDDFDKGWEAGWMAAADYLKRKGTTEEYK